MKNKEVICTFKNNTINNKLYMPCTLELDNSNVTNIELIPNFDLNNIEISVTVFANNTMKDLGKWNDYNGFSDVKIFILDNSYYFKNRN